uniref:Iron-sulfur cluster assembly accessory protein n=1 Tax=Betaphycus gelatinus TaxID=1191690 RepID=A0A8E7PG23_9FLOR|nr:iron-sulfur cluster assembly accessory protein [Betaphycus gelatinus]
MNFQYKQSILQKFMQQQSNQIIRVTDMAINHLQNLSKSRNDMKQILLRISIKQGGCAGMSYTMDFEEKENIKETDQIIDYEIFQIICDCKSILYLYGMSLDYNDSLINGGFQFINPNVEQTCGCGKSFSV